MGGLAVTVVDRSTVRRWHSGSGACRPDSKIIQPATAPVDGLKIPTPDIDHAARGNGGCCQESFGLGVASSILCGFTPLTQPTTTTTSWCIYSLPPHTHPFSGPSLHLSHILSLSILPCRPSLAHQMSPAMSSTRKPSGYKPKTSLPSSVQRLGPTHRVEPNRISISLQEILETPAAPPKNVRRVTERERSPTRASARLRSKSRFSPIVKVEDDDLFHKTKRQNRKVTQIDESIRVANPIMPSIDKPPVPTAQGTPRTRFIDAIASMPTTPAFTVSRSRTSGIEKQWYTIRRPRRDTLVFDSSSSSTTSRPATTSSMSTADIIPYNTMFPSTTYTSIRNAITPITVTEDPVDVQPMDTTEDISSANPTTVTSETATVEQPRPDTLRPVRNVGIVSGGSDILPFIRVTPGIEGPEPPRTSMPQGPVTITTSIAPIPEKVNCPIRCTRGSYALIEDPTLAPGIRLRYPPSRMTRLPFTPRRPLICTPTSLSTIRLWTQTKLKAALEAELGMRADTFALLVDTLESHYERPDAPEHGWIWIPIPTTGIRSAECRRLAFAEFEEELVEAVLGPDSNRRALVSTGKLPVIGYLLYQTALAARKRKMVKVKKVSVKKREDCVVSFTLFPIFSGQ